MDSRFTSTFGKRARLLRQDLGVKQGEVAEQVGVRQSYMSEIEGDKAYPTGEIIAKLARALNTTTDYLLLLTDNPSSPEDVKPTFLFEETEQAARMIDEIKQPEIRAQVLSTVVELYNGYQERASKEKHIRELLALIEATNGTEYRREIERRLGLRGGLIKSNDESLAF